MKRWLAVTVTGAVLALGAPAGAQQAPTWSFTGGQLLQYHEYAQNNYVFGVLDGFHRARGVSCPAELRRGTILFQAQALMKERPDDLAIESLIAAMGQLGCRWTKTPPASGPSS